MKVGNRTASGSSLATLYLAPGASAFDVKRAYHSLLRQLHPDTGGDGSRKQFSAVVEAYRDLEDSGYLEEHADDEAVRRNGLLLDVRA